MSIKEEDVMKEIEDYARMKYGSCERDGDILYAEVDVSDMYGIGNNLKNQVIVDQEGHSLVFITNPGMVYDKTRADALLKTVNEVNSNLVNGFYYLDDDLDLMFRSTLTTNGEVDFALVKYNFSLGINCFRSLVETFLEAIKDDPRNKGNYDGKEQFTDSDGSKYVFDE